VTSRTPGSAEGRRKRACSAGTSPAAYPAGPGDRTLKGQEVCVMQNAETVLGVLRERGRRA